jgi:hypothetical protein
VIYDPQSNDESLVPDRRNAASEYCRRLMTDNRRTDIHAYLTTSRAVGIVRDSIDPILTSLMDRLERL